MAVTFKALWGPSDRKEGPWGLAWTFVAVWQNGSGQRYVLRFDAETRSFQTIRKTRSRDHEQIAAYIEALPLDDGKGAVTGRTVTEILKSKLPESDIVICTRLGILHRRAP